MRNILFAFVMALSATSFAQPVDNLLNEVKNSNYAGTFHFEVYKLGMLGRIKLFKSNSYDIQIQFGDQLTDDGQIPYLFGKDTTSAKGFEKFVFEKIDAKPCQENEPRYIEVTGEKNGVFKGAVNAASCKDGERKMKRLAVQSIQKSGDKLDIVISDKAIGPMLTFKVIYSLQKVQTP